jgi:hypothetical protein
MLSREAAFQRASVRFDSRRVIGKAGDVDKISRSDMSEAWDQFTRFQELHYGEELAAPPPGSWAESEAIADTTGSKPERLEANARLAEGVGLSKEADELFRERLAEIDVDDELRSLAVGFSYLGLFVGLLARQYSEDREQRDGS